MKRGGGGASDSLSRPSRQQGGKPLSPRNSCLLRGPHPLYFAKRRAAACTGVHKCRCARGLGGVLPVSAGEMRLPDNPPPTTITSKVLPGAVMVACVSASRLCLPACLPAAVDVRVRWPLNAALPTFK